MYVELCHGQLKLFFFLLFIGMIVLHTDWLLIRFELMFFHGKTMCLSAVCRSSCWTSIIITCCLFVCMLFGQITGNLILIVSYAIVLAIAAKMISGE